METLDIKVLNPGDYTIRTGEAEDIRYPEPIVINGVIDAPWQFLKGKNFDEKQTHIRIHNQEGCIQLFVNDTDNKSKHVISGSLTSNKDLIDFQINSLTHRFPVDAFLRFIKTKRYFFKNKEQHGKLVSNLQSWNAKIETVLNNANDQKGNSNFQIEQKVRAVEGFVDKFDLRIPIYQGDEAMDFTVEIGLDPKNTAVNLYLFSDELFELAITRRGVLMGAALKEMEQYNFSKVVVS